MTNDEKNAQNQQNTEEQNEKKSGMKTWQKVALVIGGAVVVGGIVVIATDYKGIRTKILGSLGSDKNSDCGALESDTNIDVDVETEVEVESVAKEQAPEQKVERPQGHRWKRPGYWREQRDQQFGRTYRDESGNVVRIVGDAAGKVNSGNN
jgi:hypothetical protein